MTLRGISSLYTLPIMGCLSLAACQTPSTTERADAPRGISDTSRHEADAQCARARDLIALQRFPEALEACRNALRLDPFRYQAHLLAGTCYFHLENYPLEIAEYKKCLALNPTYEPALLNLGHALLSADRLQEAGHAYRDLLALSPSHPVARYNLTLIEADLQPDPALARSSQ